MFSKAPAPLYRGATTALWQRLSILRWFSSSPASPAKQMPPRPKIDPSHFTKSFLKGTGPGGQAINKTNSAVQLTHKTTGIVVKSQATRSRTQNLKIAMGLLADKIEQLEKGDKSRAAIVGDVKKKKKASKTKKSKRKYRKLEEEREGQMEGGDGEEEGEVEAEAEDAATGKEEGVVGGRGDQGDGYLQPGLENVAERK